MKMKHRFWRGIAVFLLLITLFAAPASAAEGGFTEGVRSLWEEHSAEVFSALALLGSVLVAVLYKAGLLPLLKKALGAIGATAKQTAGKTEELAHLLEERQAALAETLLPVADRVEEMKRSLEAAQSALQGSLERLERLEAREGELLRLSRGQADMLHGLSMGANLPKFRKDAIDRAYLTLSETAPEEGGEEK